MLWIDIPEFCTNPSEDVLRKRKYTYEYWIKISEVRSRIISFFYSRQEISWKPHVLFCNLVCTTHPHFLRICSHRSFLICSEQSRVRIHAPRRIPKSKKRWNMTLAASREWTTLVVVISSYVHFQCINLMVTATFWRQPFVKNLAHLPLPSCSLQICIRLCLYISTIGFRLIDSVIF